MKRKFNRYVSVATTIAALLLAAVYLYNELRPVNAPDGDAVVTRVVDGDTVYVRQGAEELKVRIIGIDTPELNHKTGKHECFAQEATEELERTVLNRRVHLEKDESQGDSDRYDRLLRHVYFEGESVAEQLIRKGFGVEYTYDKPYRGQTRHLAAQNIARFNAAGLWSVCR